MRNTRYFAVAVLTLIALVWGFFLYKYSQHRERESFHGAVYNIEAPDFTLTGHNGGEVSLSQFRGKAVPVFFGYTNCPDICPVTLSVLKNVMGELGSLGNEVQVLFITVDPTRDDLGKLKGYVPYFHESFIGLTGTPEEIERVTRSFNVSYFKENTGSEAGYVMTHTSSVYLIEPNGKFFIKYNHNNLDPELIAEDIKRVLG